MAFKTEHASHSGGTCMFYVQDSSSHGGVIGSHTYVFQGCRPASERALNARKLRGEQCERVNLLHAES